MLRTPRSLTHIIEHSGGAAALVAKVRAQQALLALVKQELDAPQPEHLSAALLRNRQLVLYTDSSAWASRLRFGSRILRDRLGGKGLKIEKITVRIALPHGIRHMNKRMERHISRENGILIEKTAAAIEDPALRQALQRLSRHSH
ncbi:MAG: DUF721 domain-containing protein [Chromatiaceae bacterium]|nr:DUF721 domain-containing protein [Gammaproteobacteria bacterium]MCB1880735.1 DUF721 domain-containing protein [Gammaproteobacteria bacterium]MCP5427328.1 DUF721 domain-containing protein [Chromatiaceae bacterium]MCP5447835.1 DUF721 domain-containing protein [Chromatiaceae bacterium]